MSDMDKWREELWSDATDNASSDSHAWVVGTEWGADWMLKRLENARADAWDEAVNEARARLMMMSMDEDELKAANPYR